MKITLEVASRNGDGIVLRLIAFNDSPKPVDLDRRLLVGPSGVVDGAESWPVSLEPPTKDSQQNIIRLNPRCFYGREREFTVTETTTFHGYLAAKANGFLPEGPANAKHLVQAAAPLRIQASG
ncbi:MAG: hypothetical protein ABI577_06870 [bacterium]